MVEAASIKKVREYFTKRTMLNNKLIATTLRYNF